MGRGSGRRNYASYRDCRRCGERFGNAAGEDYRNCRHCREVLELRNTGAMSMGKFRMRASST